MRGIIIGAGIGGLSTAIAMRLQQLDVRVFEAAKKMSPIGAGILLPPNAMILLERYGLAKKVRDAGVPLDSLAIRFSKVKRTVNVSWQIGKVTNLTNKVSCKIRDTLFRSLPTFMAKQSSRFLYDVSY